MTYKQEIEILNEHVRSLRQLEQLKEEEMSLTKYFDYEVEEKPTKELMEPTLFCGTGLHISIGIAGLITLFILVNDYAWEGFVAIGGFLVLLVFMAYYYHNLDDVSIRLFNLQEKYEKLEKETKK